jgi:carboxymethylenebutenolidase
VKRILALLALALLPAALDAADVTGKMIKIKSGEDEIGAYVAMPEGKGPFPGIVVIQEFWGLTDWIKENARRLAGQGYVALAPDLYRGKVAEDPMTARKLMQGMPMDRALGDLKASLDALAKMDSVDKSKLGSIGWCMGGGYSLQVALKDERVKACVMCYGRVVTEPKGVEPLKAAVLGIFGEEDMGIKAADVRKFEGALKEAGKKSEGIKLFKAGHGFMRPKTGSGKNPAYREEEANQAWKDIEGFFAKTLKGK